jgi:triacylglycerol lipase
MSLLEQSVRERGTTLSLFAIQCYQDPEKLFTPGTGVSSLEPLKKFLNKSLPPTYIDVQGAQAYVMSDATDVLIACRGTEPKDINDVKADANAAPVPHPDGGIVHAGFYAEYLKVIDQIQLALTKHNKSGNKKVWVCGHSLGGAVAVLVAAKIKPTGGLYTYGQPRVGDRKFMSMIDFTYFRYVNNNDVVTTLPPSFFGMGFKHGGKIRYINCYGNIRAYTKWQRIKDRFRGHWYAIKKLEFFDGIRDHSMINYYTYISNMDDIGNQKEL